MDISPTASWIRWCMRGEVVWTYLVWAERSTHDSFWVSSHRFISATGEQKGIIQTIYSDWEPPSRMRNSLLPSAKLRSGNLPFCTPLVWGGRGAERNPSDHFVLYRTDNAVRLLSKEVFFFYFSISIRVYYLRKIAQYFAQYIFALPQGRSLNVCLKYVLLNSCWASVISKNISPLFIYIYSYSKYTYNIVMSSIYNESGN